MYTYPYGSKFIREGVIPNPRISLQVRLPTGFVWIRFLVDSGADVTTLPFYPYGEFAHFRKNPIEKITIGGIEGLGVNGYPTIFDVRLEQKEFKLRCYFIESRIEPLLGRLDFWNLFSLHFDNQKRRTILIPL